MATLRFEASQYGALGVSPDSGLVNINTADGGQLETLPGIGPATASKIIVLENGEIVEKKKLSLPKEIRNVIRCKNPRCITSIEQELDQVFVLTDPEKAVYRCKYCEEKYHGHRNR